MNDPNLGRLEPVNLRVVWKDEARDFTPWLARPQNLELLADTLGLELDADTVETEKDVGPFRADILCRETGSEDWVLIENQLGPTDHAHLGQLLTYAAGLRAVTVVWIAERFIGEHRAALDRLNQITDEKFRFFGVEIRLGKIGESLPAPMFNVVSEPNDWSREVARAARGAPLTEKQEKQKAYWAKLHEKLNEVGESVLGNRKPQPEPWMDYYGVGPKVCLRATMTPTKDRITTRLAGPNAKAFFSLLESQRAEIEQVVGSPLEWEDYRIVHPLDNVDPFDEKDWPRQHEWLAHSLNAMHSAFSPRIRNLDPEDLRNDEDE